MRKYRIRQTDQDWYWLEVKRIWWPVWSYVSSGKEEQIFIKFELLAKPPVKESGWIK